MSSSNKHDGKRASPERIRVHYDGQSDRRQFLRTAGAGAALSTLAARPVWGACTVSGAMSGGSVRADQNIIDYCYYDGGPLRSPGYWKDLQPGAVRDLFGIEGNGSPHDNQAVLDKMAEIEDVKANNTFIIPSQQDAEYGVGAALDNPGGLPFNLAAIWLDGYYGFTPPAPPGINEADLACNGPYCVARAQAWVTHFDALAMLNGSVFSTVFTQ